MKHLSSLLLSSLVRGRAPRGAPRPNPLAQLMLLSVLPAAIPWSLLHEIPHLHPQRFDKFRGREKPSPLPSTTMSSWEVFPPCFRFSGTLL